MSACQLYYHLEKCVCPERQIVASVAIEKSAPESVWKRSDCKRNLLASISNIQLHVNSWNIEPATCYKFERRQFFGVRFSSRYFKPRYLNATDYEDLHSPTCWKYFWIQYWELFLPLSESSVSTSCPRPIALEFLPSSLVCELFSLSFLSLASAFMRAAKLTLLPSGSSVDVSGFPGSSIIGFALTEHLPDRIIYMQSPGSSSSNRTTPGWTYRCTIPRHILVDTSMGRLLNTWAQTAAVINSYSLCHAGKRQRLVGFLLFVKYFKGEYQLGLELNVDITWISIESGV